jgi:hypothetical protein
MVELLFFQTSVTMKAGSPTLCQVLKVFSYIYVGAEPLHRRLRH